MSMHVYPKLYNAAARSGNGIVRRRSSAYDGHGGRYIGTWCREGRYSAPGS